jgi:hypothetical protein
VIAQNPAMISDRPIAYAALITAGATRSRGELPLAGSLLILGVLMTVMRPTTRRRSAILAACLGLLIAAAVAGCGGGDSNPNPLPPGSGSSPFSSSQAVQNVASQQAGFGGLPLNLGTITAN